MSIPTWQELLEAAQKLDADVTEALAQRRADWTEQHESARERLHARIQEVANRRDED